jgi:predicted RNA-binding protein with PIN domain
MGASGLRSCARGPWLKAVLEPLVVIAGFLAFGLAWAVVLGSQENRVTPSQDFEGAGPEAGADAPAPRLWLIDGYNVLHAGVLRGRDRRGWWTASVQSQLVAIADTFEDPAAQIIVVFDAAKPEAPRAAEPPPPSRVRLVYAPSADDWLVRHVRTSQEPERIAVVTADRQVQGRARHGGASVVSPLTFLARCNRSAGALPAKGHSGDVGD